MVVLQIFMCFISAPYGLIIYKKSTLQFLEVNIFLFCCVHQQLQNDI